MIAHRFANFRKLGIGAAAAIGFYIVTSQVAAERNALDKVERRIRETERDIVQLETELGTRGSMRQLERWNGEVLALTTPGAEQFVADAGRLGGTGTVAPGTDAPTVAPTAVLTAMRHPDSAPAGPIIAAERSDATEPSAATETRRAMVREARARPTQLAQLPGSVTLPGERP